MTFRIHAARESDLKYLYEMAKLTGGGFTNLPPDRNALMTRLERSAVAFSHEEDAPRDEVFVLVLENIDTGEVRGTCQVFTKVGQRWPFYSYRVATLTKHSEALGRTFRADILNLVNDLEGSSEVGGLFLHPGERAGGLGLLLARSRYLFIARHRGRFADRVLAELRGIIDEAGGSPFWDGVAGRFFGMTFQDADQFNAIHGNQFIADLMPRHPVYIAMLPEAARGVMACALGNCFRTRVSHGGSRSEQRQERGGNEPEGGCRRRATPRLRDAGAAASAAQARCAVYRPAPSGERRRGPVCGVRPPRRPASRSSASAFSPSARRRRATA